MWRMCLLTLLLSLFVVPALAEPLQIGPGTSGPADWQILPPAPTAPAAPGTSAYAISAQANRGGGLGGGFIEFLARGAQRSAPPPPVAQPVYQPAPEASQPPQPPESLSPLTPAEAAALTPELAVALGIELPQAPVARPEPAAAPLSVGAIGHRPPPVDPRYDRQVVVYTGDEKPGTIIIDTPNKFLYLVQEDGKAMRYGIGVGRPGFTWAGEKEITAKREWPDWIPPDDMLHRQPHLPHFMAGGPENPLGARAMYLGSTLYRIHGSNEPWTIGTNVSSGCIRLRNADVIDLYNRVKVGTKVVVM
jgi:lipoprotein-anchoring transpeptidase ErfK/SrfK